jgi:hypothetical protein
LAIAQSPLPKSVLPYSCYPSNPCVASNTYACLGSQCVYSSGYINWTSTTGTGRYQCTCQCPYGSEQGMAYASQNSSAACVDACRVAPDNPCNSGNTYACLGTDCAFSSSYLRRCFCECPFGDSQGSFYTLNNGTERCVNACIAISSNNCTPSNTQLRTIIVRSEKLRASDVLAIARMILIKGLLGQNRTPVRPVCLHV